MKQLVYKIDIAWHREWSLRSHNVAMYALRTKPVQQDVKILLRWGRMTCGKVVLGRQKEKYKNYLKHRKIFFPHLENKGPLKTYMT